MRPSSLVLTGLACGLSAGLGAWALLPALGSRWTFDLELSNPESALGVAYWGERELREGGWQTFTIEPGRQRYRFDLPADARVLRVHPGPVTGPMRLYAMEIRCLGARLRRFDAADGLERFQPWAGIGSLELRDGALRMEPTGPDPAFGIVVTEPLGEARRSALWGWTPLVGLLAGLVGAGLCRWIAGRRRQPLRAVPGGPEPAPAAAAARAVRRRGLAVFAVSTLVSVALGLGAYRLGSRWLAPAPVVDVGDYTLCVVDRQGLLLSSELGSVKFLLDPMVGYRNYPNQRSQDFVIDSHGYRGGFDAGDPRPRAMVLGGSTAFGHGLGADELCLSARLEALDPGRQYVNAAVIGHESGQELAELVHRGDLVDAEVFIAFDGWNDFFLQRTPNPQGMDYGFNRTPVLGLERILAGRNPLQVPVAAPLAPVDPDVHERSVIDAYIRNLARMHRIAATRGARFLVAFQPDLDCKEVLTPEEAGFSDPERHAPYVEFLARAREFCEQNGIAWIDLNREPRIREHRGRLFMDRVHLTAEGTHLVAEILMERLRGF